MTTFRPLVKYRQHQKPNIDIYIVLLCIIIHWWYCFSNRGNSLKNPWMYNNTWLWTFSF